MFWLQKISMFYPSRSIDVMVIIANLLKILMISSIKHTYRSGLTLQIMNQIVMLIIFGQPFKMIFSQWINTNRSLSFTNSSQTKLQVSTIDWALEWVKKKNNFHCFKGVKGILISYRWSRILVSSITRRNSIYETGIHYMGFARRRWWS